MLTDAKQFAEVEEMLRENGTIAAFEAEHGEITGRMFIDYGPVPSTLTDSVTIDENTAIFRGSFDFCNSTVGVAMDLATGKPKTDVWVEEQKLGAYRPNRHWVEYFLAVLADGYADGAFAVPVFAFVNDSAGFEIYPASAE